MDPELKKSFKPIIHIFLTCIYLGGVYLVNLLLGSFKKGVPSLEYFVFLILEINLIISMIVEFIEDLISLVQTVNKAWVIIKDLDISKSIYAKIDKYSSNKSIQRASNASFFSKNYDHQTTTQSISDNDNISPFTVTETSQCESNEESISNNVHVLPFMNDRKR